MYIDRVLEEKIGCEKGIIKKYFSDCVFTEYETRYRCDCSKDYVDKVLISLGEKEFSDIMEKDGKIEVLCEFCDKKYVYNAKDAERLFGKANVGKDS